MTVSIDSHLVVAVVAVAAAVVGPLRLEMSVSFIAFLVLTQVSSVFGLFDGSMVDVIVVLCDCY